MLEVVGLLLDEYSVRLGGELLDATTITRHTVYLYDHAARNDLSWGTMSHQNCELADRRSIRAFRVRTHVLIVTEGQLPDPGFEVDIVQSPLRIYPQQFNLLRCRLPGIFPQVVTPYVYAEIVTFPEDQDRITVHHADGSDQVDIAECGEELAAYSTAIQGSPDGPCPDGAEEAVGFSRTLSFDQAFANALANLPPSDAPFADALARVEVLEVGGLFGGFPGFHHLFVRVCRTIT